MSDIKNAKNLTIEFQKESYPGISALKWYFRLTPALIITVPVFCYIAYYFLEFGYYSILQYFALIKVGFAVYGLIGLLFSFSSFPIVIFQFTFWPVLLSQFPQVWRDSGMSWLSKIGTSILFLILALTLSRLVHMGVAWVIVLIANQDPCTALQAGITGTIPCY